MIVYKNKVFWILWMLIILCGCSTGQMVHSNERTDMWIHENSGTVYYQTILDNRNVLFQINNNKTDVLDEGLIFQICSDENCIYYTKLNFSYDNPTVSIIQKNLTDSNTVNLFTVDYNILVNDKEEYLYKTNDKLYYFSGSGTLYEYDFKTQNVIQRLHNIYSSSIYDNCIYYADERSDIYSNNLSFNNEKKILDGKSMAYQNFDISKDVQLGKIIRLTAYNDYLYFLYSSVPESGTGILLRTDMEGNKVKKFKSMQNQISKLSQYQIYDNKIYFLSAEGKIYVTDVENDKICDIVLSEKIPIESFYIYNNRIYYSISPDKVDETNLFYYDIEYGIKGVIPIM